MKEKFIVYEITNERRTGKGKSFDTLREAKEFIKENKGSKTSFEFYIEKEYTKELENNKEFKTTYKLKPAKKPELTAEEIKKIKACIKEKQLLEKLEELEKYLSWKACK